MLTILWFTCQLSLVARAFGDLSSLVGCSGAVSTWFLQNARRCCLTHKRQRRSSLARVSAAGWHTDVCCCHCGGHCCALRRGCKVVGRDARLCVDIQSARNKVVRACKYHTRALRRIRPLLTVTVDTAKSIATSIVGARLDYCNSLLHGTLEGNLPWTDFIANRINLRVL